MATVNPLNEATGFFGTAFWFSAGLCVLSLVINGGYVLLTRRVNGRDELSLREKQLAEKRRFHPSTLLDFAPTYWCVIFLSFLLGSQWTVFLHANTEMIKVIYGNDNTTSALLASISQIAPIFFSPFMGYIHDRFGLRRFTVILSSLCLSVAALLIFLQAPAWTGMLAFSVSLAIGPVAMVSVIPYLVSQSSTGTAFGIYKSATNIGDSIFDILIGVMQDHHGYRVVLIWYICAGLIGVLAVAAWYLLRSVKSRLFSVMAIAFGVILMIASLVIFGIFLFK